MMPSTAPQSASPDPLPKPWIERLFARFATMYGRHWLELWNGVPMDAVMATWAEDLAGCTADQLRRALDHCRGGQKFPPTCPEFLELCRQFRATPDVAGYLKPPTAQGIPANIQSEIDRFLRRQPGDKRDPKDWARKILANPSVYPHISSEFAREALESNA
jgi:hypothetical protein